MTCPIANSQRYLMMSNESAWGELGTPSYYHVPVFSYSVKLQPKNRQANPFIGTLQRKHNRLTMAHPVGQIHTGLYGYYPGVLSNSLAEEMVNWAFAENETVCRASKTAEWSVVGNADNRRHLGLRVDSAVLKGSEDQQFIDLTLGVEGYTEVIDASAEALPADMNELVEFEWGNTLFYLGADKNNLGSPVPIKAFALQRQWGLETHYMNSTRPTYAAATRNDTAFTVIPLKTGTTYDEYIQDLDTAELYGRLIVKGLHMGTGASGTLEVLQFDFPRMSFVNKNDSDDSAQSITFETLNWSLLKPDDSDNSVIISQSVA
mgnify:CR=1 FL=1